MKSCTFELRLAESVNKNKVTRNSVFGFLVSLGLTLCALQFKANTQDILKFVGVSKNQCLSVFRAKFMF